MLKLTTTMLYDSANSRMRGRLSSGLDESRIILLPTGNKAQTRATHVDVIL